MTFTRGRARHRLHVLIALLVCMVACRERDRERDRPAEEPLDRLWPAYWTGAYSGRASDTVHVRYAVDSSGQVDSASFVVLRSTTDILTSAVRASLLRTHFRPAVREGQHVASQFEERFVFERDSAAALDSLVVVRDTTDSIPENTFGSRAESPRRMQLAWAAVREAYQPVLIQLLETSTLSDPSRGRHATICLGALSADGRSARDPAAAELLRQRGRHVVPIDDCPSSSGIVRADAPPPAFKPAHGAPAPVYITPELESWTADIVWLRANVVQHHGVDVHQCEAKRAAAAWTASCKQVAGFIF